MRRIIRPAGAVPTALLSNQAAGILTTRRRALVAVDVVEVAEKRYHIPADGEEVVARLRGVVVVALPVEVRVGGVGVLKHHHISTCFVCHRSLIIQMGDLFFVEGGKAYGMVQLIPSTAVRNVLLALEAAGKGLSGVGTDVLSRVVGGVGELVEDVVAGGVDVVLPDAFRGAFGDHDGAGEAQEGGEQDLGEEHRGRLLLNLSGDCWTSWRTVGLVGCGAVAEVRGVRYLYSCCWCWTCLRGRCHLAT